ncbi:hypothetical protein [Nocardia sp. NPDC059195]|uniref:hypothetical protein n=1 Tax=Nocardia sp. NPDC059195 TaxID=3346765 RepID=UPI0036902E5D
MNTTSSILPRGVRPGESLVSSEPLGNVAGRPTADAAHDLLITADRHTIGLCECEVLS